MIAQTPRASSSAPTEADASPLPERREHPARDEDVLGGRFPSPPSFPPSHSLSTCAPGSSEVPSLRSESSWIGTNGSSGSASIREKTRSERLVRCAWARPTSSVDARASKHRLTNCEILDAHSADWTVCLLGIGIHADQPAHFDRQARLFENFSRGRLRDRLAGLDVSARQTPMPLSARCISKISLRPVCRTSTVGRLQRTRDAAPASDSFAKYARHLEALCGDERGAKTNAEQSIFRNHDPVGRGLRAFP